MSDFIHVKTISDVYNMFPGITPPHPLITVFRQWPQTDLDFKNIKFTSDLYYIALKGEISGAFTYGRSTYDYQEGTMIFLAPGQAATFSVPKMRDKHQGWTILFHPDLIRKTELGRSIKKYSFFNYDSNEALHLSEKEKQFLTLTLNKIEQEINQNMDKHSQELIVHHLETIIKYSNRYYDRQFYTRSNINKDFVTRFEVFLQGYFSSPELAEKGVPSVSQCGEALNMSGPYLSDLLKNQTGRSAKDHIYGYLIDKAKTNLLNSNSSISEIAFGLGFDYPQNFSKLFKAKTGMSPTEYRNHN